MFRRHWFQFQLRTAFVAVTVLGIWLGVYVNKIEVQRSVVSAVRAHGGIVVYDWQKTFRSETKKHGWIGRLLGDDAVGNVRIVVLGGSLELL